MKRNEALRLRGIVEQAVQSLADEVSLTVVTLYPAWTEGIDYSVGFKVRRNDTLWRCIQAHTSQRGWEPENVASLWEQINESNSGTVNDPIPYEGNMALTNGLHYAQDGLVYRCIRDTVNPVYHALADLVGLYVEVV